jgi:phage protein U
MWYLNTTRIYVQNLTGAGKQTVARLQPLSGPTVHQVFGYESEIFRLKAIVIGETDLSNLKGLVATGSTYTLSGYGTNYGSFYVTNVSWDKSPAVIQTVTADCDDPMFTVDLELFKT